MLAAWLNHVHLNQHKTLDVYVEQDDRSFVRHHLIAFSSSLGSGGHRPNAPRDGVESDLDMGRIGVWLFTGGFYAASRGRGD